MTRSLAAYSVICYLMWIKDRHNGNLLVTSTGSIVHIDFGFILGITPGEAPRGNASERPQPAATQRLRHRRSHCCC